MFRTIARCDSAIVVIPTNWKNLRYNQWSVKYKPVATFVKNMWYVKTNQSELEKKWKLKMFCFIHK